MPDDRLLNRITEFLDANYPCGCADDECTGNYYEAIEIVELVRRVVVNARGRPTPLTSAERRMSARARNVNLRDEQTRAGRKRQAAR